MDSISKAKDEIHQLDLTNSEIESLHMLFKKIDIKMLKQKDINNLMFLNINC